MVLILQSPQRGPRNRSVISMVALNSPHAQNPQAAIERPYGLSAGDTHVGYKPAQRLSQGPCGHTASRPLVSCAV